jgi:hypothetical protein
MMQVQSLGSSKLLNMCNGVSVHLCNSWARGGKGIVLEVDHIAKPCSMYVVVSSSSIIISTNSLTHWKLFAFLFHLWKNEC